MPLFYVTTFCNFAHRLKDGKPIEHECHILPVDALKAEMADDVDEAMNIIDNNRPLPVHPGVRNPNTRKNKRK